MNPEEPIITWTKKDIMKCHDTRLSFGLYIDIFFIGFVNPKKKLNIIVPSA